MSAELIIKITEEKEKSQLDMQVMSCQDGGTELERAIISRLTPFIETCLDGFQKMATESEKRNEEIEAAQQSRIILP
jgi:hypothetical protein